MSTRQAASFPFPLTPFDMWNSFMTEGCKRVDSVYEEMQKRSLYAVDQTTTAIGEMAKLSNDSFGVAKQLSEEWFKVMRGATKWAGDAAQKGVS